MIDGGRSDTIKSFTNAQEYRNIIPLLRFRVKLILRYVIHNNYVQIEEKMDALRAIEFRPHILLGSPFLAAGDLRMSFVI